MIKLEDLKKVKGVGPKLMSEVNRMIEQKAEEDSFESKYDNNIHLDVNDIYHGDCLELMNGIPDNSVDMILADLPYGTTQNDWDSVMPLGPLWKHYNRIIKDNGAIVLFSQSPFNIELANSNIDDLRYEWIWEKEQGTGFLNANRTPLKIHENILVFYKKQPTYNPQGLIERVEPLVKIGVDNGSNYGKSDKGNISYYSNYPTTVLKFKRDPRNKNSHPTQKPVALLEYLIKTYTDEGEIVLDNVMGGGSTIVASINTNRNYIGIEKELKYYEMSRNRLNLLDKVQVE